MESGLRSLCLWATLIAYGGPHCLLAVAITAAAAAAAAAVATAAAAAAAIVVVTSARRGRWHDFKPRVHVHS